MFYQDYLKKIKTCPFCKAKKRMFIDNESAYLTYSKAPYHQHHLLVIPKRHVVSFFNLSAQEDKDIAALVKIGAQILKKLKYDIFSILVREGPDSDKSIKQLNPLIGINNNHRFAIGVQVCLIDWVATLRRVMNRRVKNIRLINIIMSLSGAVIISDKVTSFCYPFDN